LSTDRQEIAAGTDAIDVALKTAVQPNPTLGVLMQTVTAGAFLGTLVAYHRRRKNPAFDPFPIVTRWSVAGLVTGVGFALHATLT
jgi:hypothetical protein